MIMILRQSIRISRKDMSGRIKPLKKARSSPRSEDWTKQETLILILKSALRAKPEIRYSICLDGTPINPLAASCRGMK